jgi:CheY-like chemotaxis protein
MVKPAEGPVTIAILGDNPVIGKALESLLASADYVARFFSEYPEGDAEALGGARVALILPDSSSRRQEALKAQIKNTPSTMNLPVIELTTTPNDSGQGILVPWPSTLEDLQRSIDETLLDSS